MELGISEPTKRNGITPDVDTQNGEREAKRCKEATRTSGRTPETVEDSIKQVPLVPVCLSKLPLHSSRCTNAEEEDQCLASKYGRCLSPSSIFGSSSVSCQIRLL